MSCDKRVRSSIEKRSRYIKRRQILRELRKKINSKNPNKLSNYAEAVKGGQQHLRKGFNTDFRPWIKCHVIKESEVVLKKDQDILTEDKY
ncbi:uncharacterized protein OCT59_006929 [Rhizophagus irregularis]|uniref:Uncharacterized protein n=2 Tax=Rhizophagus irregularis TaxID=588596 RepID=A0A916EG41_9GLOM|nr:hypothetical protein RirG_209470 [Rhizophagus irregularis DAOM 197198w]UZO15509.1 hypothetical protein OCT59_006929 [Rhizophagus irregularis]GBC32563.2 hypothetical protein GLOIN_2v1781786 [Rhizophagus irregularis DAOM 181602=DAOM 197198]CAB5215424.1 unnamed protein product [Rhizophagus irregularis]CAB5388636.1 unnamed protein product [Rhizophagus irregularis]